MNGHVSDKSWYSVKYIDGLAKAYLPLLNTWVTGKKTLDKAFMLKTIQVAKTVFPNGPHEIAPNFMGLKLFVDNSSIDLINFKKTLKNNFRIQSFKTSNPMKDSDWTTLNDKGLSSIMLLTSNHNDALNRMNGVLDTTSIQNLIGDKKDFMVILPLKVSYIFWINVAAEPALSKLLEELKKTELLPEAPHLITP